MRKSFLLILSCSLVLGSIAYQAKADALGALAGGYAFNSSTDLEKTKCVKMSDALLKAFKSPDYNCDVGSTQDSTSGNPMAVCTKKDLSEEYLIFQTQAVCETERLAQAASGD